MAGCLGGGLAAAARKQGILPAASSSLCIGDKSPPHHHHHPHTTAHRSASQVKSQAHELRELLATLHAQRDAPPLPRHAPPRAGALAWAGSLRERASSSTERLMQGLHPGLAASDDGRAVRAAYKAVDAALSAYEAEVLGTWAAEAAAVTERRLRQPLLRCGLAEGLAG